jgi:hypothetical protein
MCVLVAGCSAASATESTSSTSTANGDDRGRTGANDLAPVDHDQHIDDRARTAEIRLFRSPARSGRYGHTHHDYPASDVFGCGADVVAPVRGKIAETRTVDPWVPKIDDPATRGGKYVSMEGDDGVRYYFAHSVRCRDGGSTDRGG